MKKKEKKQLNINKMRKRGKDNFLSNLPPQMSFHTPNLPRLFIIEEVK